jgi:hypothetical protein
VNDVCDSCGVYLLHGGFCGTCVCIERARLEVNALAWVAGVDSLVCLEAMLTALDAVNARVARLELRDA